MPRKIRPIPTQLQEKLITLYTEGLPMTIISEKLDIHIQDISKFLKSKGKIRFNNRGLRKYTVNDTAFAEPLSELALYFLGIMCSDGSIGTSHTGYTRLTLGMVDKEVILKFKEFLQYSGDISTKKFNYKKDLYTIRVGSSELVNSLIAYGCGFNKTLTLKVTPRLANSRDFWRGIIDGDGHLLDLNKSKKPTIGLITGSEEFSEQYIAFCRSYGIKISLFKEQQGRINISYRLKAYSINSFKLARLLYKDCCFAMERKLQLYKDFYSPPPFCY